MAKKPQRNRLAQFRVSEEELARMNEEVVQLEYTDLSDMLRAAYREFRERHIAGKVQDGRRRQGRK